MLGKFTPKLSFFNYVAMYCVRENISGRNFAVFVILLNREYFTTNSLLDLVSQRFSH